jgi:hypothetical protein
MRPIALCFALVLCAAVPAPSAVAGSSTQLAQAASTLPRPVRLARNDAAHRRDLRASQVRVVRYTRRTWPDGCLGLGGPDVICTQALVDGYRAVFEVRGRRVVYRTDMYELFRVER